MKVHRFIVATLSLSYLTANLVFALDTTSPNPLPTPRANKLRNPLDSIPTTEPANRDGERHRLINSRAKPGEVDLLFLGDSITANWEKNGSAAWGKYFGHRKPMNAGISGDRTQHVLWRLDNGNIKNVTPKAVVIMIGSNNSSKNTSVEIAAGITAIVKKLRKELPGTKILLLATFPRGKNVTDKNRKVIEGSNAIIAKLADDDYVHFMDIGSKFKNPNGTISREIMPDLLHLSPKGYDIWGSAIDAKVGELMGEQINRSRSLSGA